MAVENRQDNLGITTLTEQARAGKAKIVVPKQQTKGFVRVKYIHGRPYYYLVKSIRVGGKVKQKVIRYLGSRKPTGIY